MHFARTYQVQKRGLKGGLNCTVGSHTHTPKLLTLNCQFVAKKAANDEVKNAVSTTHTLTQLNFFVNNKIGKNKVGQFVSNNLNSWVLKTAWGKESSPSFLTVSWEQETALCFRRKCIDVHKRHISANIIYWKNLCVECEAYIDFCLLFKVLLLLLFSVWLFWVWLKKIFSQKIHLSNDTAEDVVLLGQVKRFFIQNNPLPPTSYFA